jgi:hypothetical protein
MCVGNVLMWWLRLRVGLGGVEGRQPEQTQGGFCRIAVHHTREMQKHSIEWSPCSGRRQRCRL